MGDINTKHLSWGSPQCDRREVIINNIFLNSNLEFLNDGSPTYLDVRRNIYSHIDITACNENISHKFNWSVHPNKYTSDHYPILIDYNVKDLYTTKPAKWKLEEANWNLFQNIVNLPEQFQDPNSANESIVHSIKQASLSAIPRTGTKITNSYCCF